MSMRKTFFVIAVLVGAAFAASAKPSVTYESIDEYALKRLKANDPHVFSLNEVRVLNDQQRSPMIVVAAQTAHAYREVRTSAFSATFPTMTLGDKRGVIYVLRTLPNGRFALVASSPRFCLPAPWGLNGGVINSVKAEAEDRFWVEIENRESLGSDTLKLRFAKRNGNWLVSGFDLTSTQDIGRAAPAIGVAGRRTVNLLNGRMVERSYSLDESNQKMLLERTTRTRVPSGAVKLENMNLSNYLTWLPVDRDDR